jgi:hypothetical protein
VAIAALLFGSDETLEAGGSPRGIGVRSVDDANSRFGPAAKKKRFARNEL